MNLRDRGYGDSTEGLKLKKQERHSREKKVTPGEAPVQKGQAYQPTRSLPSYGAVPEYSPVAPSGSSDVPINLQFTDDYDRISHDIDVEAPYKLYSIDRDSAPANTMSLEEIQRRLKELEQAMSSAYDRQNIDRMQNRVARGGVAGNNIPGKAYVDYRWDVAEALDDAGYGVGVDDATQQLLWQNYLQAAAAGKKKEQDYNYRKENEFNPFSYDNASNPAAATSAYDLSKTEASIDAMYREYTDLKNEYNTRLARYLQSIGG